MVYEIVPSAEKAKSWDAYQQRREALVNSKLPTSLLLPQIHTMALSHYDLEIRLSERQLAIFEKELWFLDRPDSDALVQALGQRVSERLEEIKGSKQDDQVALLPVFREICGRNSRIELDVKIPGELRSYGKRSLNGGPFETVFASHNCNFTNDLGLSLGVYFGLSTGLDEVYELLCRRYDDMMGSAKTQDDRLVADAFLQLWGTRVLHPFWDGNGRNFGYHLAVRMEQEGAKIPDFGYLDGMVRRLTNPNDAFFKNVLRVAGLSLITEDKMHLMYYNPAFRADYMRKLASALREGISEPVNLSSVSSASYFEVAQMIESVICDLQGRPYKRRKFKQGLLDAAKRDNPESIVEVGPFFITAIGIQDERGNLVKITLDEMDLEGKAKEIMLLRKDLQTEGKKLNHGGLQSYVERWEDNHPFISLLLSGNSASKMLVSSRRLMEKYGMDYKADEVKIFYALGLVKEGEGLNQQIDSEKSILSQMAYEAAVDDNFDMQKLKDARDLLIKVKEHNKTKKDLEDHLKTYVGRWDTI